MSERGGDAQFELKGFFEKMKNAVYGASSTISVIAVPELLDRHMHQVQLANDGLRQLKRIGIALSKVIG